MINQQLRQRRGSGSGLALVRSLSSSAASASGAGAAAAAADPLAAGAHPNSPLNSLNNLDQLADGSATAAPTSSAATTTAAIAAAKRERLIQDQLEARRDLKAAFCVFDLDGDGSADMSITMTGVDVGVLTDANFLWV